MNGKIHGRSGRMPEAVRAIFRIYVLKSELVTKPHRGQQICRNKNIFVNLFNPFFLDKLNSNFFFIKKRKEEKKKVESI